jgi:uncharacterized protein involved in exopolysaccharide biosynthesis/Mrp family chromosome partitioning ATPase
MNNSRHSEPSPAISLGDIYFVLFRHKWKIIILAALGIVGAAGFYLLNPPVFQSEAKLFIRYVLDTRSPNPTDNNTRETAPADLGASLINSEVEILTSFDIAEEVATNIGPQKILSSYGGGSDLIRAANVVKSHLVVEAPKDSSILDLSYRDPDPLVVQPVLTEIINDYLDKHLQVHQSIGSSDDFLTEETAQLRSQISGTEDELRQAKSKAGIVSVDEADKFYGDQIAKIREDLYAAETELAERGGDPATADSTTPAPPIPPAQADDYKRLCAHLTFLQQREDDYLSKEGFTDNNQLVKEVRDQIDQATKLKKGLEAKYPTLAGTEIAADSTTSDAATPGNPGPVIPLATKISVLKQQLSQIEAEAANASEAESKISDLQRKKQMEEGNYQYFATSLEQERIDEALGPGRVSNISAVQRPSPPFKDRSKSFKKMLAMVAGGIFAGVGWAFLIEFYFDRSVKRPIEVESRLKLPLFLSIPDTRYNGYRQLEPGHNGKRLVLPGAGLDSKGSNGLNGHGSEIISLDAGRELAREKGSFLNPFYDALRDRLMLYFESINLTRKPKLVAVTGTDRRAGVSTIAAGLAASLSETGDGRVLLVDMNVKQGAAQQLFFHGKRACQLDDALIQDRRDHALVQDNLYVVNEGSDSEKLQRLLPKRMASIVPKLKASDYDYIIFDMPPVSQTSVTARLAGLMDMTLLVVESEKTEREAVQQATALLALSKASVAVVLNKTRKYVPDLLQRESLGEI